MTRVTRKLEISYAFEYVVHWLKGQYKERDMTTPVQ